MREREREREIERERDRERKRERERERERERAQMTNLAPNSSNPTLLAARKPTGRSPYFDHGQPETRC